MFARVTAAPEPGAPSRCDQVAAAMFPLVLRQMPLCGLAGANVPQLTITVSGLSAGLSAMSMQPFAETASICRVHELPALVERHRPVPVAAYTTLWLLALTTRSLTNRKSALPGGAVAASCVQVVPPSV